MASRSSSVVTLEVKINGEQKKIKSYPMARLLDVLREEGFTGTKEGCGEGECGACSVMLNGELVNSCLVPFGQVENAEVKTIEGIADGLVLHRMQESFLKNGGAQCGICTPGMVLASINLIEKNPNPNREQIKEALAGNLCRCTGYMKIFDSVKEAIV